MWRRLQVPVSCGLLCLVGVFANARLQEQKTPTDATTHEGTYDASAAVALNASLLVVANDEDNELRVYDRGRSGAPVAAFDLSRHLDLDAKNPEVDLEGATRLGDHVYWVTSHGTGKTGDPKPERRRLFATKFTVGKDNNDVRMEFVGKPVKTLLDDIIASPQLKKYDLAAAAKRAPKDKGGLNIEGLAATPTNSLLIGLRSPLTESRHAIVIPLANPEEVVIQGKPARFDEAIEVDLGGLGVRGMEYCPAKKSYVVLAGPQSTGTCRIYLWTGNAKETPKHVTGIDLGDLTPESCIADSAPGSRRVQIVSDDGELRAPEKGAKTSPATPKSFRSAWIRLE